MKTFSEFLAERATEQKRATKTQLTRLEKKLNVFYNTIGIDLDIDGKHFIKRIKERSKDDPITIDELRSLFRKIFNRHKATLVKLSKDTSQKGNIEAVLKDLTSELNIPIVIEPSDDPKPHEAEAKTIVRRNDFRTPDPVLAVESLKI